ncbi:uncharacterized protein LOC134214164 [Armigeres subalbatus]|uniref:uncharacterized protein LOC134214164 n=1 Tax=Armigeres subalbatus TaxID=124917 RepID=UPI002ED487EB
MIPTWKRVTLILMLSAMVVTAEVAQEENATLNEKALTADVEEGRTRKRFYKFLIKALAPLLSNVLSTIVMFNTKVVVLAIFLAGIYFFGHKIWPGGFCGHSIVSDSPPPFFGDYSGDITDYHGSGPDIISSYPGPEPISYSSPSFSYPPIESISNSYLPPSISSSSSGSAPPPAPSSNAYLPPNRRGKRDVGVPDDEELLNNEVYWTDQLTDMAFRFLGVTSRACRKRFVCEFDFHARKNPFILFATRAMGRDVFHNYREENDEHPKSYQDCGRIYAQCGVPKVTSSNNVHRRRRPLPTTTTAAPTTAELPNEDDELSNDIDSEIEHSAETGSETAEDNTERSFDTGPQNDWQPMRMDPLKRLFIPLLSPGRQTN